MIFFMMVYPQTKTMSSINDKYRVALMKADIDNAFTFNTKSDRISKEAADFLHKTLVRDQKARMNWQ